MNEHGKDRFVFTKSYEIAYSLFRIAGVLRENDFAERLRSAAGALLEAASVQNHAAIRQSLQSIECFIKFAGDVNLLAPANADTILREVYLLDAAVIERINSATSSANGIDFSEIFSHPDLSTEQETYAAAYPANAAHYPSQEPEVYPADGAVDNSVSGNSNGNNIEGEKTATNPREHSFMKSDMRQSAIMERIRQYGNCRLKDIQEILPGCSERTIRYDLQSLLERNLIERTGAGGPSVTYRMRQTIGAETGNGGAGTGQNAG